MKEWALAGYLSAIITLLAAILLGVATQPVFWALYALTVLLLSVYVFAGGKAGLWLLIIFDLFVFLIFAVQFPGYYQVDRDSGFETSYAQEIAGLGRWDPRAGSGYAENYYGFNPLLHFILAFISLGTGVSAHVIGKWALIIFFRLLFMALSFRILELITKERRIALISLLIFAITPRLRVLYISRRLVAAVCILLAIYSFLMSKEARQRKRWLAASVLFSSLVIMADHTLALVYGIFLGGYVLFSLIGKAFEPRRNVLIPIVLGVSFFLAWAVWNIAVSPTTLDADAAYAASFIGWFHAQGGDESSSGGGQEAYSSAETLLIMGSQAVLFLAAGVGILWMLFKGKFSWDFMTYWTFVSVPFAALMTYLISTGWVVFSNVTLWFFLLPLCAVCGTLLAKTKGVLSTLVSLLFIAVIFSGGILLAYHPNVLFSDGGSPLIEAPEYKGKLLMESAEWLFVNGDVEGVVIGDRSVFDVYSAYFGFEVTPVEITQAVFLSNQTVLEERFLKREIYYGSYSHTSGAEIPRYLVINRDLLHHESYYFTLSEEDLAKFDSSRLLQKVYDNGRIVIYENLYRKSASLG